MTDEQVKPPTERPVDERLFVYWDGTRKRAGDPLAIARRLERACPDYLDLLALVGQKTPEQFAGLMAGAVDDDLRSQKDTASEKLLKATLAAFQVAPVDIRDGVPVGLTENECGQLLVSFVFWMGKAAEDPQVGLFSTSQPRASPSIPPDSATADSSASGSNAT